MSSLWTPSGEHRPEPADDAGDPSAPGAPGAPGAGGGTGEPELDEEQAREMLARLAATPVEVIVADHAARLHELVVLHLSLAAQRPESLDQAALALDAMAALVEGLGDRLGPNAAPLRDALGQLRVAYVQVRDEVTSAEG